MAALSGAISIRLPAAAICGPLRGRAERLALSLLHLLKRSLAVNGAAQAYNRPEIAALPPPCRQIVMATCGTCACNGAAQISEIATISDLFISRPRSFADCPSNSRATVHF